jgi:hypothetical protein
MQCPSCGAAVEEGADLCLECGEPMGDSPAARVARTEAPTAPVPRIAPEAVVAPARAAPKKKWKEEEPEAIRCPGCGIPSKRERCPGCGVILRRSDD